MERKTIIGISSSVIVDESGSFAGIAKDDKVYRKLAMCWGVTPIMKSSDGEFYDAFFKESKESVDGLVIEKLGLKPNDTIIITGGNLERGRGTTNMIMLESIR